MTLPGHGAAGIAGRRWKIKKGLSAKAERVARELEK